ncbi:hypothetical protein LPMP_260440 [Leishmania panamensis]|uniref:Transmembrane protein n=1 Tax=Leishmania panamensis TaxID=5679 RepID=A0A088RT84_LEIPA|nr:hypothetical protein LPMP_260440 [Leishmania panamensis]AIN99158.1 hypothetical protein LPMP_260440 [Leishmania panamensis]
MQTLALYPLTVAAVSRPVTLTLGTHGRRVSVAMREPQRTFAAMPPPSPSALSSMAVAAPEGDATATSSCREDSLAGPAAPPPPHLPPAQMVKGFRSGTRFKLSPTQVNEKNVPSAREVGQMIPTLQELHAQLPDAQELEQMFLAPKSVLSANEVSGLSEGSSERAAAITASSTSSSLLQKTTGPLENFLFGPPKDESAVAAEVTPTAASQQRLLLQRHLLACRALFWGTAYALLGFSATVITTMYLCGYYSLRDLQQGMRDKVARDEERLRTMAAAAVTAQDAAADTVVEHYVIDLSHPVEAWQQIQEIWGNVQRLADAE